MQLLSLLPVEARRVATAVLLLLLPLLQDLLLLVATLRERLVLLGPIGNLPEKQGQGQREK